MTIKLKQIHLTKWLFLLSIYLFSCLSFSQNKTVTLNVSKKPLSTIIQSIEQQTGYRFIYNSNKIDVSKTYSVNVTKTPLIDVLNSLFKDEDIAYAINSNQVLLTDKKNKPTVNNSRLIKGKVLTNSDNFPLAGATVLIKGKSIGAVTDIDGNFVYTIKGDDIESMELEASYLGMKSQSLLIGNKTEFIFKLEEDISQLTEVVITSSYGTEKLREEVVGSISTLYAKDIAVEQASESIDKMIEGQIAGVLVENTSGVGGPVKINIRGQGSLTPLGNSILGTSTQPLIIIDGVIMAEEVGIDSDFFDGSGTFSENLSNPLAQIAPETIESINVLKDAAAVSIYGADGANGVIIITTKKGKSGRTKFGFTSQLGVSNAINQIKYLNGKQYSDLRNEYLKNTGGTPSGYNGIDTDWFDLLNGTGIYNKYGINVSGGNDKLTFRTNLSYLKIDEPQLGNNTNQLNLGVNLGYNLNKLSISASLNPSFIKKEAPNIYYNYAFAPTLPVYDETGNYALTGVIGLGNPLAAIEQNRNIANSYGLIGSINAKYQLSDVFTFTTLFGLDYKDKEQDRYFSGANESGRPSGNFILNGESYKRWGRRVINKRNSSKWNWNGQLSFQKNFNEAHNLDGILGFEISEEKANFDYASGAGFVNPNIVNAVTDAIQDDDPETEDDDTLNLQTYRDDINYNSRVSLFSQINYNYKKRYFVLGNIRRDQSSVFGSDTDVAYNGGLGVAWILTNENFLNSNNWLDFLKLKVSYGTSGNSRIGSYRSKGLYATNENGYNGLDYANTSTPTNPNLGWERNTKFDTGLEATIFKNVTLNLNYFYDAISDLITSRDLPSETGYNSMQMNAANMYNKGIEFSTNIKWFNKAFKWRTSFNIATLKNKVTHLEGLGDDFSLAQQALAQKIGYSTSIIWGLNYAGIDPATGRELVEVNNQIYDAAMYNSLFSASDWVPIGDRQSDVYGGFSNTFSYKGLNLSIRGSYQLGGSFLVEDELISQYRISSNRNMSVNAYDYWREPGDIATQPLVTNNNPLLPNSSKFLYDASYLKISNINLNYNVPVNDITFLDTLNLFADISNVLYWYKEKSPEGLNGIREFRFKYPQARTISLGINAKF
ncbi:SusC/RagA family TonB-linked outer membrane protein [Aestuariibaculum sediminum]|uniref:SusC/RagA family TonB-linked outer membrane protein n=1 Tax=Aestuariibaculum sediminum TaxID=2770637 RepID=A0A8J6Q7R9_9FLAO|nr:SusC/RagA family TonB-linked outer membrane protein [Aestuariibaculum sediminum]MBD0830862.1 SusC/RagA family TonB-linked outer membrane protein [Aestuariibaculum sediminum]